jgi:hypothetical protein
MSIGEKCFLIIEEKVIKSVFLPEKIIDRKASDGVEIEAN